MDLEAKTIYILRESFQRFQKLGMLWSMGKDSTALLWMAKKAFGGEIPFPVFHIDTSYKMPEMIQFREELTQKWKIPLQVYQNKEALPAMNPSNGRQTCCETLKTKPLKKLINENQLQGLIIGIRRDEEGSRSKERYFSPRSENLNWDIENQPPEFWNLFVTDLPEVSHYRVHPILHWREVDIWKYIAREKIPVNSLYFAKDQKRYRSLGCAPCTHAIASNADSIDSIISELEQTKLGEREGRSQDQETKYGLQKLRQKGYM